MGGPAPDRAYRCPRAARLLPRVLGGAVLAAALIAGYGMDPAGTAWGSSTFRMAMAVAGVFAALWIVRQGSELRHTVRPTATGVMFEHGRGRSELRYDAIEAVDWDPPFGPARSWVPAASLVDDEGRSWRLCAPLADGRSLVEEILRRAARDDLRSWVSARGILERMERGPLTVAVGYVVSLVVLAASVLPYLG